MADRHVDRVPPAPRAMRAGAVRFAVGGGPGLPRVSGPISGPSSGKTLSRVSFPPL
jgi:hypothetical protein